jgi:hypothetical protein
MLRIRQLHTRSGVAMASAVVTVFAAASLIAILLTMAIASNRSSGVTRENAQGRYLAEGALEAATKIVQDAVANWGDPSGEGEVTIGGVAVRYTIAPLLDGAGNPSQATVVDAVGIQSLITTYEITATAVSGDSVARASRVVNAVAIPIFQFAVFYDNDLEINPGPNMTLGGRIHSNKNMHLGSDNTLTLDTNYVRAVGGIYRCRKDNPLASNGTVQIRKWVEQPFLATQPKVFETMMSKAQLQAKGVPSFSGYDTLFQAGWDANGNGSFDDVGDYKPWVTGAQDLWGPPAGYAKSGKTVMSGVHGAQKAVPPSVGSIQPFEPVDAGAGSYTKDAATGKYQFVGAGNGNFKKGFFHSKAALSFLMQPDGTVQVTGPGGATHDAKGNSYATLLAGVYSVKQIYDARQAEQGNGYVKVIEIDISKLNPLIDPKGTPVIDIASGPMDNGGIVLYGGKIGAGKGLETGGMKFTGGSQLAVPMTLVSESPIYVQGDFNTGGSKYAKKGASAISDAVNLLSNSWNDTKTPSNGLPVASNTTYNLALITGNLESAIGKYNGGLENLPRFHENWSGKTCTIKGSFVNTWTSSLATGTWVHGGKIYSAPQRAFSYDTDFNTIANLPPFTPSVVFAEGVVTW